MQPPYISLARIQASFLLGIQTSVCWWFWDVGARLQSSRGSRWVGLDAMVRLVEVANTPGDELQHHYHAFVALNRHPVTNSS